MPRLRILFPILCFVLTAAAAQAATILVQSVGASGDTPTAVDNDFTRIDDALQAAVAFDTIELAGTFDWTEANAAASWALGSDGTAATGDDYAITVPAKSDITLTAASLGAAVVQGPGDLPAVDLEAFLVLVSETGNLLFQNWTISNLEIRDFDLSIALFFSSGGSASAFDGLLLTHNLIRMATDLNENVGDAFQNIGIHYSFGQNQTISDNVIEIPGNGVSDTTDPDPANHEFASSVAMQSNTSGGTVYEGLLIDGNEVRVLEAPSVDPEFVYGIWENGHAHSANITVSNNRFLNLSPLNDPGDNLQRAFRVTSHSSATTTVTYSGNEVEGANVGLAWLTGFGGLDFSAHDPVQVLGNTFLGNGTAVQIRSQGSAVLRCNRFAGNDLAISNDGLIAAADAVDNWFGCSDGPGLGDCDANDPAVGADPWLVLGVAIDELNLLAGETAVFTADLDGNSDGAAASCTMPDGIPVSFQALNGGVAPSASLLAGGSAQTTFTAGGDSGLGAIAALVDADVRGLVVIVDASMTDLAVTKSDGVAAADPGDPLTYTIAVTNTGAANVSGASVADVLPVGLSGCAWTCAGSGGGTCTAAGVGDVLDTVGLPAGAAVVYTLACTFDAFDDGIGQVVNTATATLPMGMTDPNPANDAASDLTIGVPIFADGFESGNVSAWSSAVGFTP